MATAAKEEGMIYSVKLSKTVSHGEILNFYVTNAISQMDLSANVSKQIHK